MKVKCGICGLWGLYGGVVLHPRTTRQTTRCATCRDDEVVVSRQEKPYKPPTISTKQEEKQ